MVNQVSKSVKHIDLSSSEIQELIKGKITSILSDDELFVRVISSSIRHMDMNII